MGAKLKYFFDFLSGYLRVWLQRLKKNEYDLKKISWEQIKKGVNPLKKLLENAPKKSYKQNKFDEHE